MDNPDFQPPKARSMSDAELEAALEQAKLQADGMLGAMMLLEQESQLRAEDEAATAQWLDDLKNDPRPEAQLAAVNFERSLQGLDPISAGGLGESQAEAEIVPETEPEPQPDPFFEEEPEPKPEADSEQPLLGQVRLENDHMVIEPEPIPAPTLEEAAFDELLAMGAAEATTGIDVVPDFSVTDVIGQIVSSVEQDLDKSPEEAATALEETEADNEIDPVPAFAPVARTSSFNWPRVVSNSLIWSLLVPVLVLFWGASVGMSLSTAIAGSAFGTLLAFLIGSGAQKIASRGTHPISILSRATFGVFGNALPSLFILLFRVLLLTSVITIATRAMSKTVAGLDLSSEWNALPLSAIVSVIAVVIGLGLVFVSSRARSWAGTAIFAVAAVWILFSAIYLRPTAWIFGSIDLPQAIFVAIVLALVRASLAGANLSGLENSFPSLKVRVGFEVLVPMTVTVILGSALLARGASTFDIDTFSVLVLKSEIWFGTLANIVLTLVTLMLVVQMLEFAAESGVGLFLGPRSALVFAALLALITVVAENFVAEFANAVPGLLIFFAAAATTWLGLVLAEILLRRQDFHDVSLMRSYGFYKRFSIFALFGFLGSMVFALAVVEVSGLGGFGFASGYLDSFLLFGSLSAPVFGFLFGMIWSFITCLPRVRRQEQDISAVDERKQQIAGIDFLS